MRKACSDGHHAEIVTGESVWSAPDRLPPLRELQDARRDLEAALTGASAIEIGRHIDRLAQLTARREGTPTTWAVIAAEYARLLGHHPADIWAASVDAWLRTPDRGRWFPSISELEALMAPLTAQRKTQLVRCKAMLARAGVAPQRSTVREPMEERIAAIAAAKRAYGLKPDQSLSKIIDAGPVARRDEDATKPLYVWIMPDSSRKLAAERPEGGMSLAEASGRSAA